MPPTSAPHIGKITQGSSFVKIARRIPIPTPPFFKVVKEPIALEGHRVGDRCGGTLIRGSNFVKVEE